MSPLHRTATYHRAWEQQRRGLPVGLTPTQLFNEQLRVMSGVSATPEEVAEILAAWRARWQRRFNGLRKRGLL